MHFNKPFNIHVIHSDPIVAAGLSALLTTGSGITVCEVSNTYDINRVCDPSINVLVTDYDTGIKLAEKYRGQTRIPDSAPRILIVTSYSREWEVHLALNVGVHGYLLQQCSAEELILATRTLSSGTNYVCQAVSQSIIYSLSREMLTARETSVLALLVNGACNRSIASTLGITVNTIKAHVKSILEKLHADSRTEAAAIATRRGLIRESHTPELHSSTEIPSESNRGMQRRNVGDHSALQPSAIN